MPWVHMAKALRDQHLNSSPNQIFPFPAKKFFRLRIDQNDFTLLVDNYDRIRCRLEQTAKLFLGTFALGNIASNHRRARDLAVDPPNGRNGDRRSEEHTSELQSR